MRKIILSFFLFLCPFALHAATLEQRIAQAQSGDFIVTAQENNYSLLFIRSLTSDTLLLEEISVPAHQIDLKKIRWKDWAADKAPGHTSWTLYEIERKTGKLIECFSYSKNGWLYLEESEQFLTKLLTLPLGPIPENERKKIGPQPANEQEDHRAVWNPPLVIEGKKMAKPSFDVLKGHWPDDGSRLSRCLIELYFIKDFPLPYWIDVQSPHYNFKLRTIDSGHNLISAMTGPVPHRAPKILGLMQKEAPQWKLSIQTPLYFQKLYLYVLDLTQDSKTTTAIPFSSQPGEKNEEWILEIAAADLNRLLQKGHRYRWVLIPEECGDLCGIRRDFSMEMNIPSMHPHGKGYRIVFDKQDGLKLDDKERKHFEDLHEAPEKNLSALIAFHHKHPEIPEAANLLAFAYLRLKKRKEAEKLIEKTYLYHPNYLIARINYADQQLRLKKKEKFPPFSEDASDLNFLYPEREMFHYCEFRGFMTLMGFYHLEIGEKERAEEYYQLAFQVDPLHPSVSALEKALSKTSFLNKLFKSLQRLARISKNK